MKKEICPVCNSSNTILKFTVTNRQILLMKVYGKSTETFYDLFLCKSCKAQFIFPFPTQKNLKSIYNNLYSSNNNQSKSNLSGFFRTKRATMLKGKFSFIDKLFFSWLVHTSPQYLIELSKKFKSKKFSILDIGCGQGLLLTNVINNFNVDKHLGLDFSKNAIKICRKLGLNAKNSNLSNIQNKFDVITANHVLEHIPEPQKFIREVHSKLNSKGIIVFSLPNSNGIGSKIFGKYWQGLSIPKHLVNYNKNSLKELLTNSDFEIISYSTRNIYLHSIQLYLNKIKLGGFEKIFPLTSLIPAFIFFDNGDEQTVVARKKYEK